jgi:hypothetical protein
MINVEARTLQIGGKANAHLSAGSEQRDFGHLSLPY